MDIEQTIKISALNLADWCAIACALGKDEKWGFYRWQEHGSIPSMIIEEWESIANAIGFSNGWEYHQYKDQKNLQPQG